MNNSFTYLLESALIEAFDLPKTPPKYDIIDDRDGDIEIDIPELDITLYIDNLGSTWIINFKDAATKSLALTGKFKLDTLPKIFSVIIDMYKKAETKPKTLEFSAAQESNGKDVLVLIPKKANDLGDLAKTLFPVAQTPYYRSFLKEVIDNKYTTHPANIADSLEGLYDELFDDDADEVQELRTLINDLSTLRDDDISQDNRRNDIYKRLTKKYWPSAKIIDKGYKTIVEI